MNAIPSDTDYNRPVIVVTYDPNWPKEFDKIRDSLWLAIRDVVERVEHVGSTSVPGLAAKPVIDIDVVISETQEFTKVKTALESLGYWHNGNQGIPGREAFKYDPAQKPDLMRHHLYVCAADSAELKRHLTLRDHLRRYPTERDAYAIVKLSAAQAHPDDIDGYIEAKSPFVRAILDQYAMNNPLSVIANTYALQPQFLVKIRGGWSAEAYRVEANEGTFFLKVYDKTSPSVASFIRAMSAYLPVLRKLNLDKNLSKHLPEIVPTHNGALSTEDTDHVFLLYRFIEGKTIGDEELTEKEVDLLADLLGRLHAYHADLLPGNTLSRENFQFDLSIQLHFLRADRRRELPPDLWEVLVDNKALLDQALNKLSSLADQLKSDKQSFCLVHADMHNRNLMRSGDDLIILDMEDLCFSLPELDLMFLVDKPYYPRFLARYKQQHPDFDTNLNAITYFWLRRDLTDVVQFGRQIAFENLDELTRADAMHLLRLNFENLRNWLQR
ncbi:MAG: GrpB family protein [Anaerolineaceae bacterium]